MIGTELHFKAIFCFAVWNRHHTCVVDQDVQFVVFRLEGIGKGAHRYEGCQIEVSDFAGT